MNQKIYQKQFSIGEMLSESWKYFSANFQSILAITLMIYIPVNAVTLLIPDSLVFTEDVSFSMFGWLEFFAGIIATMTIAFFIKNKIDEKVVKVEGAFKKVLSLFGGALWTNIILSILLLFLTLLFIIPGVIFGVYWIFTTIVIILKEKTGMKALQYSKEVVNNRWWLVFGYLIVFGILYFLVSAAVIIPQEFIPQTLATNMFFITLMDIFYSFFSVLFTIFFINFDATKIIEKGEKDKVN